MANYQKMSEFETVSDWCNACRIVDEINAAEQDKSEGVIVILAAGVLLSVLLIAFILIQVL